MDNIDDGVVSVESEANNLVLILDRIRLANDLLCSFLELFN